MNIYLLENGAMPEKGSYWDSCVVIAKDPIAASEMHPEGGSIYPVPVRLTEWPASCHDVKVTFIGTVPDGCDTTSRVVCASYQAG